MTDGSRLPRALPFVDIEQLGERPHVIVDGAPRPGSVAVLSHWPVTTTPPELARDLSAQIAFAYLREPGAWAEQAIAVTNDHFDVDGLAAMYTMFDPRGALQREAQLVGIARVGDFGVADDREVARIAFAIDALTDRVRSPFADDVGSPSWSWWTTRCYSELLERLPSLLDAPGDFAEWWEQEDALYAASLDLIEAGALTVSDSSEAGLAIVQLADGAAGPGRFPIGHGVSLPVHPVAVKSATSAPRILFAHGRRYCYLDRYETWVRWVSRALPLRRDLGPLAAQLSEAERSGVLWHGAAPNSIEPVLGVIDNEVSSLSISEVSELVIRYMIEAPAAWDPFQPGGSPAIEQAAPRRVNGRAASTAETSGRGRARWRDRRPARPST